MRLHLDKNEKYKFYKAVSRLSKMISTNKKMRTFQGGTEGRKGLREEAVAWEWIFYYIAIAPCISTEDIIQGMPWRGGEKPLYGSLDFYTKHIFFGNFEAKKDGEFSLLSDRLGVDAQKLKENYYTYAAVSFKSLRDAEREMGTPSATSANDEEDDLSQPRDGESEEALEQREKFWRGKRNELNTRFSNIKLHISMMNFSFSDNLLDAFPEEPEKILKFLRMAGYSTIECREVLEKLKTAQSKKTSRSK